MVHRSVPVFTCALGAIIAPLPAPAQEPAAVVAVPVPVVLDLPPYPPPLLVVAARPPVLAEPVRDMLKAIMKTEDTKAVETVVNLAVQTNPYDKDEIRAMHRAYLDRNAQLLAARSKAETERIRNSGVLELWKGQIELGAFRGTGNTDNFGFTGAVKLERKGIDWEHTVELRADYQKDRDTITREQYFAAYQPRYTLGDGIFTYARAQFEKDRIQGYNGRSTLSGGFGYRAIARKRVTLSIEAGPAVRRTDYVDQADETTWSALGALDFDWIVSPTLKITQDASAYVGSDNNTFTSLTGLEAGMARGLKARLSYAIEHETSPPAGALKTDTISRFSLVYGF
ncbi:YdiY family protein [Novosphingobium colocasiae]|uniref:DUF481 domain-containing protein n=1 Tax=Novosphingobium colocasiae TaxID=1256513 RepID=UPI0035B2A27A